MKEGGLLTIPSRYVWGGCLWLGTLTRKYPWHTKGS